MLGVLFGLFYISSLTASEWIYYKHYPWVYDHISEDWLYLRGVDGGKIYAYRASSKEWEEFKISEPLSWEEKYQDWMKNPSPCGGIQTLEWIKEIKDDGLTERDLGYCNITDLTPLEDLVSLEILDLSSNQISDLSPLEGLTDLGNSGSAGITHRPVTACRINQVKPAGPTIQ